MCPPSKKYRAAVEAGFDEQGNVIESRAADAAMKLVLESHGLTGPPEKQGHRPAIHISQLVINQRNAQIMADDARVAYRANSMTGQAMAARAGLGIALLPRFMGDNDAGLERLFAAPSADDFHLWLLIHADLRQTARVRAFVDFIAEAIIAERALYEGGRRG